MTNDTEEKWKVHDPFRDSLTVEIIRLIKERDCLELDQLEGILISTFSENIFAALSDCVGDGKVGVTFVSTPLFRQSPDTKDLTVQCKLTTLLCNPELRDTEYE